MQPSSQSGVSELKPSGAALERANGLQGFAGTDRFEPRRWLGSGTAGVVYEAWDRERGGLVALKLLHQSTDASALYRFKQEFRALAHLSHPNLIRLYELQNVDDQWFVTMELVDGVDVIRWAREPRVVAQGPAAIEARLRPVVRQIVQGLDALHVSGRLHRDIKPSNVLVTPQGDVVILDFGLVTDIQQTYESVNEDLLGTPAYMAPEQGTDQELSAATDWYGVGTLVYECLTGAPPFTGSFVEMMLAKQRGEPPAPGELVPGVSSLWNDLCRDLLRRSAAERPRGVDILLRLGAPTEIRPQAIVSSRGPSLFLGRREHLEALRRAFERVRSGEGLTVYVHGPSGLGKSALIRRFLVELHDRHPEAVILTGRCYENESVPYKAVDCVIDMLTRYLRSRPDDEVAPLLPRDVGVLARLFPVLRRVRAIADAAPRGLEIPDSRELRRRAFGILRELLMRMAEDHPLVLVIDDLQWGDYDSAVLLADVLRWPDPPPLLMIGAYRDEDAGSSPLVRALRPGASSSTTRLPGEDLAVRELEPATALELARRLLEELDDADDVARRIAEEARGNPLFIDEMVRHALVRDASIGSLDEMLRSRIEALRPEARRLLEVLAVAGQPLELDTARRTAELGADDLAILTELRVGNLARSGGGDQLEVYHDRVRQVVLAELAAERRRSHHLRLARELETVGHADPETLAHHFGTAGETQRALDYAAAAAEKAAQALAFDHAAALYRRALELAGTEGLRSRALRRSLAEVLVNAGRGAEAAEHYLGLVEGATAAEALEMRRRAAEHWLVSGHIDQGLAALSDVLASIGLRLPANVKASLPGFLLRRARLRWRGLGFKERDASQVSKEELTRIDTCWSVAIGLGFVDTSRAAPFQVRHLERALKAGEPYRVARALALEVGYHAAQGGDRLRRTSELIRTTTELARRVGQPHTTGLVAFTSGLAAYLHGRFPDARRELERAEQILRSRCTGVAWELDSTQFYSLRTLHYLGEIRELQRRLPLLLKEARERGDLFAQTAFRTRIAWLAHLAEDDPDTARRTVDTAIDRWSRSGFHLQHMWALLGRTEIDLYRAGGFADSGAGESAWDRLLSGWTELESSLFQRIQSTRVETHYLLGRAAVAAAAGGCTASGSTAPLQVATRCADVLARQKMGWSTPLARLIEAGLAGLRGRKVDAAGLLDAAEAELRQAHMALHAAAARWRRSELLQGDEAEELRRGAEEWMTAQGIWNPERMTALLVPGAP